MKVKVIKTEKQYEAALARVDRLMSAKAGTSEMNELELWTVLVGVYEDQHCPIAPPDPITAIRFHMEQQGLKQADLIPYIGNKSKVSEVLSGRRRLSITMIRKLHEGLGIPAEILVGQPTKGIHARKKEKGGPQETTVGKKRDRGHSSRNLERVAESSEHYRASRRRKKN